MIVLVSSQAERATTRVSGAERRASAATTSPPPPGSRTSQRHTVGRSERTISAPSLASQADPTTFSLGSMPINSTRAPRKLGSSSTTEIAALSDDLQPGVDADQLDEGPAEAGVVVHDQDGVGRSGWCGYRFCTDHSLTLSVLVRL